MAYETQTESSLVNRFSAKVVFGKNDECWPWIGALDGRGYGVIKFMGKMEKAHRVSYMIYKGKIGDLHVLHKCDNTCCVNPDHLFLGTQADNMQDCARKGRIVPGSFKR